MKTQKNQVVETTATPMWQHSPFLYTLAVLSVISCVEVIVDVLADAIKNRK